MVGKKDWSIVKMRALPFAVAVRLFLHIPAVLVELPYPFTHESLILTKVITDWTDKLIAFKELC